MNPFLIAIVAALAVLTVWGFISPRGQWRVLAAWSRREPYVNEPGAGVVALLRIVSGVGIIVVVAGGCSMYSSYLAGLPKPPPPPGPVEQMWGSPAPTVVNRVFTPLTTAPSVLVSQPVVGYQVVRGDVRDPQYLFFLDHLKVTNASKGVGYIGHVPQVGLSALDTADLVVEVRGDRRCIPQKVVVQEDDKTVKVAVFYGQPNPSDGSNAVNVAKCTAKPRAAKSTSVLVPIDLETHLGDRTVVTVDGAKKIPEVQVID